MPVIQGLNLHEDGGVMLKMLMMVVYDEMASSRQPFLPIKPIMLATLDMMCHRSSQSIDTNIISQG